MEQNLTEISDGRLYGINDLVKAGCHDCSGCSECCRGMGTSILLDPYDVYQLTVHLGKSFEELLAGPLELHQEEGLVLPNLRMTGPRESGRCSFLNEEGRCSIHPFRPGLCRAFPLGRNYEPGKMDYFLLTHECPAQNKTKIKVSKWIGIPNMKEYHRFLITWHELTKQMRAEVTADPEAAEANRNTSMLFLRWFYMKPYEGDFFAEFERRARLLSE